MGKNTYKYSIIIPARNEEDRIAFTVKAALSQKKIDSKFEIIVVDDGSTDKTAIVAQTYGAEVIAPTNPAMGGNPAAARNFGARMANGDVLIFLDADCTPSKKWLSTLVRGHEEGATCVGGAISMPVELSLTARADYYSSWYHFHEKQTRRYVRQLPPCNLSVRKDIFLSTSGFNEVIPICYSHEELKWQAELLNRGARFLFEPRAVVQHHNRKGIKNLLYRNFRWAFGAVKGKSDVDNIRLSWLHRYPLLQLAISLPSIPLQVSYILLQWLKAGKWETVFFLPWLILANIAYGAGLFAGSINRLVKN